MQKIGTTQSGTVIVEMAEIDYAILSAMMDIAALATNLSKPNNPTMTGGGTGTPVRATPVSPTALPAGKKIRPSWRPRPARHSSRSDGGRLGGKTSAPSGGTCKFCGAHVRRKDMIACLKPACKKKGRAEQQRRYREKHAPKSAIENRQSRSKRDESKTCPASSGIENSPNRSSPFVTKAQREQMIRDSVKRADLKLCHDN